MEYHNKISRINKIDFNLLSQNEIINDSVSNITKSDTTESILDNTLFDTKMGGANKFEICDIDQLPSNKSPGYFGHINLAVPVYNHAFIDEIKQILSMVCINCGSFLLEVSNHDIDSHKRFKYYLDLRNSIDKDTNLICECCNTNQPVKYSFDKSGVNPIITTTKKYPITHIYPEHALRIFSRITDSTLNILGLGKTKIQSLIITTIPVCPPFCRPTIQMGDDMRAEDHITQKYKELLDNNAKIYQLLENNQNEFLEKYRAILHYDVATLFDNEANGLVGTKNKAGVPQLTFAQRINGKVSKEGRIRGNLMAKRVEFSARTVISPDPNIDLDQIGIPQKIAMNLTIQEKVNSTNYKYLLVHALNGKDKYPGCIGIKRKNGNFISKLKENDKLELGDCVIRHLIDEDYVLINRQPTLHKMSMMGHRVKIIPGSSFRLNINVTEPYNADFDGDEMNLHCPQSIAAQNEVKCIAAVSKQCMSPASNLPGIVFVQDNVLSSYKLSKNKKAFTGRELMNTLGFSMNYYNGKNLKSSYSGYEAMNLFIPTDIIKQLLSTDKHLDKKKLIKMLKSIWHQYGNDVCFQTINSLQTLFREYLNQNAFSLSPKDLDLDSSHIKKFDEDIQKLREKLIEDSFQILNEKKTHLSYKDIYENKIFFAIQEISKKTENGLIKNEKSRIMDLIESKSKGKNKNVMQIKGFLGQQVAGGTRITTGFTNRTLPHYEKFSEDIDSKGFVGRSFNRGLKCTEYFFHAAGGRDGLIDQALQTGQSGYLQYQMVKTLEDLIVHNNGCVKDSQGNVVQLLYGSDGCLSEHIEEQDLNFVKEMKMSDIEKKYNIEKNIHLISNFIESPKKYSNAEISIFKKFYLDFLETRKFLLIHFKNFNFKHPIHLENKIQKYYQLHQLSNQVQTHLEPIIIISSYNKLIANLESIINFESLTLLKFMLFSIASPYDLICKWRFQSSTFKDFIIDIEKSILHSRVEYGESVGITSALSIGEPSTQLVLNSFHSAGAGSSGGLPRIQELMYSLNKKEQAQMKIYFTDKIKNVEDYCKTLSQTKLKDVILSSALFMKKENENIPLEIQNKISLDSNEFILHLSFFQNIDIDLSQLKMKLLENNIISEVYPYLKEVEKEYLVPNSKSLKSTKSHYTRKITKITESHIYAKVSFQKKTQSQQEKSISTLFDEMMNGLKKIKIKGISDILLAEPKQEKQMIFDEATQDLVERDIWYCQTVGTNLYDVSKLYEDIDFSKTITNNVLDAIDIYGIETARQILLQELYSVLENVADLDIRHVEILADRLTQTGKYSSIKIEATHELQIDPMIRASYMNVVSEFQRAALHSETDNINGVSSNIMVGNVVPCGTGLVNVSMDVKKMAKIHKDVKMYQKKNQDNDDNLPEISHQNQLVFFNFDEYGI
tara:strand:+ start:127 stop:4341 length:4215 start_codon:yes stop_codon:yes gene_type:complete